MIARRSYTTGGKGLGMYQYFTAKMTLRAARTLLFAGLLALSGCGKKKPTKKPFVATAFIVTNKIVGVARNEIIAGRNLHFSQEGFLLLERENEILKISPADVLAVFFSRDKTVDAALSRKWLDALLYEPDPVGDAVRNLTVFMTAEVPSEPAKKTAFYLECLSKSADFAKEHRRLNSLFSNQARKFIERAAVLARNEKTMLNPHLFRVMIMAITMGNETRRYLVEHGRPALAEEWRRYLLRILLMQIKRVKASSLPEAEKQLAKERIKILARKNGLIS